MSVQLSPIFKHFYEEQRLRHPGTKGIIYDGVEQVDLSNQSDLILKEDYIIDEGNLQFKSLKGTILISNELIAARSVSFHAPKVVLKGEIRPLNIVLLNDSVIDCKELEISNVVFHVFVRAKLKIMSDLPSPLYDNAKIIYFAFEEGQVKELHKVNL